MTKFKQFRDPQLDVTGDIAAFYPREFYPFSNFASFQVVWEGETWPTSEHAYQTTRYIETAPEVAKRIREARSAHEAFTISMENKSHQWQDWAGVKEAVMLDICRHKLEQHEYIQQKLLQTGDARIVEDSPTDSFWGWGPDRKGKNALGKIWMTLRDELMSSQAAQ